MNSIPKQKLLRSSWAKENFKRRVLARCKEDRFMYLSSIREMDPLIEAVEVNI